jgi:hypothetical protein
LPDADCRSRQTARIERVVDPHCHIWNALNRRSSTPHRFARTKRQAASQGTRGQESRLAPQRLGGNTAHIWLGRWKPWPKLAPHSGNEAKRSKQDEDATGDHDGPIRQYTTHHLLRTDTGRQGSNARSNPRGISAAARTVRLAANSVRRSALSLDGGPCAPCIRGY